MALHHFPRITTDGLVLCLDAGNPLSYPGTGNTWTDLSENNNNGTFASSTATPSYTNDNKGSMLFDGGDYISVPSADSINVTSEISLCAWILFNQSSINNRIVFCGKGDGYSDATTQYWLEKTSGNRIQFYCSNGSVGRYLVLSTANTIVANTWYYICGTNNGSIMKGYVNGYADTVERDFYGSINTTSYMFSIGRMGSYNGLYLNGKIPQFQFYNRALSPSEIQDNYLATKGRYGL